MEETSEAIRARVQVAHNIQNKHISKKGSSDIVCNADMRRWGSTAILSVANRIGEFDASGDESAESFSASLCTA
jgi:hypothetical protein